MSDTPNTPADYIIEHATTALTCDPRVATQGIQVSTIGHCVIVRGTIETEQRRHAINVVLAELLPDHVIVNKVQLTQSQTDSSKLEST